MPTGAGVQAMRLDKRSTLSVPRGQVTCQRWHCLHGAGDVERGVGAGSRAGAPGVDSWLCCLLAVGS